MGARAQRALDRAAVAAARVRRDRARYFRRRAEGPGWREHLDLDVAPAPPLTTDEPVQVTVETLLGPLTGAAWLAHDAGPDAPVIVTHHGSGERPFDLRRRAPNALNRALLAGTPPATVVAVRAPLHEGSRRRYDAVIGDLVAWMALLAASAGIVEAVVRRLAKDHAPPVLVTGFSLGGWVTSLHRAGWDSADCAAPLCAGAHLGRQMVDSAYARAVSTRALADPDALRATLDFADLFMARSARLAPLLARHDQYARPADQVEAFGEAPVRYLETGHIGAALTGGPLLRAHLAAQAAALKHERG